MQVIWVLMVAAGVLALFFMGARMTGGRRERVPTAEHRDAEGRGGRDLGANVNPSQLGNEVDQWPDRTGARTRRELGARHAADVTFSGEREEKNKTAYGVKQSDPAQHPATADLDPEDAYGEDRPANRTVPPDQPPTQWHPREHGVPGDHIRDGHHRSATAPERQSTATDPFAHAPAPGPNHIAPEDGVDFPAEIRP